MLIGWSPPEGWVSISSSWSARTRKLEIESLPGLTANRSRALEGQGALVAEAGAGARATGGDLALAASEPSPPRLKTLTPFPAAPLVSV